MIDWVASEQTHSTTIDNYKKLSRVVVICDECWNNGDIQIRAKSAVVLGQMPWRCKKCRDAGARTKLVESSKKMWEDKDKAAQMLASRRTDEYRENQRQKALERYKNDEHRAKVASANRTSLSRPEVRQKLSESLTKAWRGKHRDTFVAGIRGIVWSEEKRQKAAQITRDFWCDPIYRQQITSSMSTRTLALWQTAEYRAKVEASCCETYTSDTIRSLLSDRSKSLWRNVPYRNRVTNSVRLQHDLISAKSRQCWLDQSYRDKVLSAVRARVSDESYISKLSAISKRRWEDPEFRKRIMAIITSEPYRAKMAVAMASRPKVSRPQSLFYSLLDDLGVVYYREYNDRLDDPQCLVGPWSFDCVIPREGDRNLLIEFQGDRIHSWDRSIDRDIRKQSYIINNLSHQYDLKYVWEHEMMCPDRVSSTIRYWLGMEEPASVEYGFDDLRIAEVPASDYRPLLGKYHYMPSAGRGGKAIGAYLENELIVVAVFSRLARQNLGYNYVTTRELSRLCTHPRYRKYNLLSWFLCRALRLLPDTIDKIISYCDTTFNHTGAVYKACNFILDGEVDRDYWYVSDSGWSMHKKTLYNKAVQCGMKEAEYALRFKYFKVQGHKKLRYTYNR